MIELVAMTTSEPEGMERAVVKFAPPSIVCPAVFVILKLPVTLNPLARIKVDLLVELSELATIFMK